MITYRTWITREMLREEPDTLFVFGDNMARTGMGGQAAEMRGEPNAVGIPTKWRPSMQPEAFFSDRDLVAWHEATRGDLTRLVDHVGKIVWPKSGIGTGRAKLKGRAPLIWEFIENIRKGLER